MSRHPAPSARVVRTALKTVSWWRRRRREVVWADEPPAVDQGSTPFDGSLVAALRRLPARQREVVALRVQLDLDTETTSRVVRIAPGTATAHLSRTIAALRRESPGAANHPSTMEVRR